MSRRNLLVTAGALAAVLSSAGATMQAQEPDEAPVLVRSHDGRIQVLTDQPRARLGLFLDTSCAPQDAETVCSRPPVVVSVVEDGPAARAGVRQLDTLVALDGTPLSTPDGRRALQSLESGTSVRLSIGSPQGRREVVVVPEIREPAQVMSFEWRVPDTEGMREKVQLFRFPPDAEHWELRSRLDSMASDDTERTFVMFGPDSDGQLRVRIVGSDSVVLRSLVDDENAETVTTGYVVESRGLAQRLTDVRDRTLRIARIQLDSLLRLQSGGAEVMVEPWPSSDEPRWVQADDESIEYLPISPPPGFESLFTANRRVAGAEFLEMTPELAEYFVGVHEGLLVLRVIPRTPASHLGLRDGDVVIEADGHPVRSIENFRTRISGAEGHGIDVKWVRKGVESKGHLSIP
jgi:membrane-associated protease RseP (regulator of RpoE activity)